MPHAKYGDIGALMGRNNPVAATLNIRDCYKRWLISKSAVGASGASIRALEKSFFAANGGSGQTYTDLMASFLTAKGYTGGSLHDRWSRFCQGGTV